MTAESADNEAAEPAPHTVPRFLPALRAVWPWLLIAAVATFGWKELREVDFIQVRDLLRVTDVGLVALLLAATAANLALGGFYDVAALGDRALPPTATKRWSVGVVAFAWSNFRRSVRSPALPCGCGSTLPWEFRSGGRAGRS